MVLIHCFKGNSTLARQLALIDWKCNTELHQLHCTENGSYASRTQNVQSSGTSKSQCTFYVKSRVFYLNMLNKPTQDLPFTHRGRENYTEASDTHRHTHGGGEITLLNSLLSFILAQLTVRFTRCKKNSVSCTLTPLKTPFNFGRAVANPVYTTDLRGLSILGIVC